MKNLILLTVAFSITAAFAAQTNATAAVRPPRGVGRFGGQVAVPNSQKGTIAILNCQKKVPIEKCQELMLDFANQYRYRLRFSECEPVTPKTASAVMKKLGVEVAVFLVDCDECPVTFLTAPEAHWSIVNVATITKGARNEIFAAARTRKEIMRAFLCAAGAMDSQYTGSMMSPIKGVADLDRMIEDIPVDSIMRAMSTMRFAGVTPLEVTTYRRACEEGWAPQPTNEFQKAVWDQVHALPTAPLKIAPETKKVSK